MPCFFTHSLFLYVRLVSVERRGVNVWQMMMMLLLLLCEAHNNNNKINKINNDTEKARSRTPKQKNPRSLLCTVTVREMHTGSSGTARLLFFASFFRQHSMDSALCLSVGYQQAR